MSLRPVPYVASRPSRSEQPPPAAAYASHPAIESNALLGGTREVLIRHGDEVYRLRHTRNDKLILTK